MNTTDSKYHEKYDFFNDQYKFNHKDVDAFTEF